MSRGRAISDAAPYARPTGALSALAQILHQIGNHLADVFQFVSARVSPHCNRAQLTGRASRSVSLCPSFSKINHIHFPASLHFVLSRKQTNNSEVFQNAGKLFHGRNR